MSALFADSATATTQATTLDRHRGRREWRQLVLSTDLSTYLAASSPWQGIAPLGQLTRRVTQTATCLSRTQTVYVITTLSPQQAGPERLLTLPRSRWHSENRLHYVRDITFGEDRSCLRSGAAPPILAAVRNLVITLIHRSGSSRIAASRRTVACCPRRALRRLLQ